MRPPPQYPVLQLLDGSLNIDTVSPPAARGPGRGAVQLRQGGPSTSCGRLQLSSAPAGGSAAGLLSMVLKIRLDLSGVLNSSGGAGLRERLLSHSLSPRCCCVRVFYCGSVLQ